MEEKADEKLTLSQIRYLNVLRDLGTKQGAVKRVADMCHVTHPTVSRFFKSCQKKGILTAEYAFTDYGAKVLEKNRSLAGRVQTFLDESGIHESQEQFLRAIFEHVDPDVLQKNLSAFAEEPGRSEYAAADTEHKPVTVSVFRCGSTGKKGKSMADRGFDRIGNLCEEGTTPCLELHIRQMHASSARGGIYMSGHLTSLKYHDHGQLRDAKIRDGRLRIPLSAFTYRTFDDGIRWGSVLITVKSSVGAINMPESTARLLFIC